MISIETRQMLAHLEWADAAVWAAVLAAQECAGDPRIRELLIHTHMVQWAYLQLWRRQAPSIPAVSEFAELGDVARWARQYHRERAEFIATLDEPGLERHIEFPWVKELMARFGRVHPTTVRQSILQIGLHSAYHRGQVNARLRELGGEPSLVDYVAWVWQGTPDAEWRVT